MRRLNPRKTVVPALLCASVIFAVYSFAEYRDALAAESKVRSGVEAFKKGGVDVAENLFRAAVRIEPSNAGGWVNLGIVVEEKGNHVEALAAYGRALKLTTDSEAVRMTRERMLDIYMDPSIVQPARRKDWYAKASLILEAMIKAEPENAELRLRLGRALFSDIRPGAAFDQFKNASRLADTLEEKWIHSNLADFYRGIGMTDKAERETALVEKYSESGESEDSDGSDDSEHNPSAR